jgi:hypothetical protein
MQSAATDATAVALFQDADEAIRVIFPGNNRVKPASVPGPGVTRLQAPPGMPPPSPHPPVRGGSEGRAKGYAGAAHHR